MKNAKNENLPEVSQSLSEADPEQKGWWRKNLFAWTQTARVRSLFISLTLLSLISLLTVLGYLIVVENQRDSLHERNHRVMDQIAQNIISRNKSYSLTAKNISPEEYFKIHQLGNSLEDIQNRFQEKYTPPFQVIQREERFRKDRVFDSIVDWHLKYVDYDYKDWEKFVNDRDKLREDNYELRIKPKRERISLIEKRISQIDSLKNGRTNLRDEKIKLIEKSREKNGKLEDEIKGIEEQLKRFEEEKEILREEKGSLLKEIGVPKNQKSDVGSHADTICEIPCLGPNEIVSVSVTTQDFFSDLWRRDTYDKFFVFLKGKETGRRKERDALVFESELGSYLADYLEENFAGNDTFIVNQLNQKKRHEIGDLPYAFYFKNISFQQEEWVLCGVIEKNQFNASTRKISPIVVIILSLIILIFLLILPILKLKLMSKNERLKVSDIFYALTSAVLNTAIVTITLFDIHYTLVDENRIKRQITSLSESLKTEFLEECREMINQLYQVEELHSLKDSTSDRFTISVLDRFQLESSPESKISLNETFPYPYFESIYWANRKGKIFAEWTTKSEISSLSDSYKIDISKREYFQSLINGQGWILPDSVLKGTDNSFISFYLESLLTLNTGENLAILAIPSQSVFKFDSTGSDTASIVLMTTRLYSLMDPILPQGFEFCLIDKEGKALFHSDKRKNLQENFSDETTMKGIQAAIDVRGHKYARGKYLGKDHRFYIQPIEGLPFYLVTFYDQSFYRSFHEQVFSLSILFFLLTYFICLILIGVVVFRSSGRNNPSSYNTQFKGVFIFDWLRPRASFGFEYRYLAAINCLILGMTIWCTQEFKTEVVPAITFISLSFIYVFINAFLRLSVSYAGKFEMRENSLIIGLVLSLWLGISVFSFFILHSGWQKLLVFQLILLFSTLFLNPQLFSKISPLQQGVIRKIKFPKRFNHRLVPSSYVAFLFTWLAVISIFPAIKFYEVSHNREWKLQTKLSQVHYLQDLRERKAKMELVYAHLKTTGSGNSTFKDSSLNQLIFHKGIADNDVHKLHIEPQKGSNIDSLQTNSTDLVKFRKKKFFLEVNQKKGGDPLRYLDSLLYTLRPPFDPIVRSSGILFREFTPDQSYFWVEETGKDIINIYPDSTLYVGAKAANIYAVSELPKMQLFPPGMFFGLFWLVFAIACIVFFRVLQFTADRITGQSLLKLNIYNPPEVAKPGFVRTFLKDTQDDIFLVIPPRAIEEDYKELIRNKHNPINGKLPKKSIDDSELFLDMRTLMQSEKEEWEEKISRRERRKDCPVIAIDYFEACSDLIQEENFDQLIDKYKIIERLLACEKPVFLISTKEPMEMQEVFQWDYLKEHHSQTAFYSPSEKSRIQYNNFRWSQLLRTFTKVYYPLQKSYVCYSATEALQFLSGGQRMLIVPFSEKKHYEKVVEDTYKEDKDILKEFKGEKSFPNRIGKVLTLFCPLLPLNPLKADINHTAIREARERLKQCLESFSTIYSVAVEQQKDEKGNHVETHQFEEKLDKSQILIPNLSFISNISSLGIIQLYQEHLIPLYRREKDFEVEILESELQKWQDILEGFSKAVLVIDDSFASCKEELIRNRVHRECIHGNFMQEIQEDLIRHQIMEMKSDEAERQFYQLSPNNKGETIQKPSEDDFRRIKDRILEETEIRAELYYHSLWTSCTNDEKYLIYDLAEDGLINPRNRDGIASLIRKGIFVLQDGRLRIFNKSFRNFVLTVIKPQDALQFEARLRRSGTWGWIRIPITLTILAIAIFLVATQRDLVNQSIAFVTGLLVIIQTFGNVTNRFNIFGSDITSRLNGIMRT